MVPDDAARTLSIKCHGFDKLWRLAVKIRRDKRHKPKPFRGTFCNKPAFGPMTLRGNCNRRLEIMEDDLGGKSHDNVKIVPTLAAF